LFFGLLKLYLMIGSLWNPNKKYCFWTNPENLKKKFGNPKKTRIFKFQT
jgi:hypothetical protein